VRLSDLLGKPVVDEDGHRLGDVHDVAARRDGPAAGEFGPALQVEALLIGARGIAARLGVSAVHLGQHALLRRLARIGDPAEEIPWEQVVEVRSDAIVVHR